MVYFGLSRISPETDDHVDAHAVNINIIKFRFFSGQHIEQDWVHYVRRTVANIV